MRRRAVGVALAVGAVGVGLMGSASATAAAPSRIVLAPNHHVSAKPGGSGGHGGGGGGGSVWPGWSSSNWSGYAVTKGAPYTAATGSWKVPTVSRTRGNTYSAAWVGVGGFNDATLIQTGTEQDFVNGHAVYAAWWTTDAQGYAEQSINMTVKPGDTINASVSQGKAGWTISFSDGGQNFSILLSTYTNNGLSAEWIMEAPGIGGRQSTIASFTNDTFDPGTVNGGKSPTFAATDGGVLVKKSTIESIPSNPDSDKDGFVIAHGSAQPDPPTTT